MSTNGSMQVSRVISSGASQIFALIRDPQMHKNFDGSQMITGSLTEQTINQVGDKFVMTMNRKGDDYLMINIVVEFELNRRLFWTPAPGDTSRSEGNLESNIGKPAGYKWGYTLEPINEQLTKVTEIFEFGPLNQKDFEDGGKWINTKNTLEESMENSLRLLEGLI